MVKKVKPPSIDKRLKHLEEGMERLDGWMENQDKQITDLTNEVRDDRKDMDDIDEKTTEAKKEITTFTFELISMIIGFLSLMIAVVVLWVNREGISNEMLPVYAALAAAFIVLFAFFVGSWIIKNFNSNRSVE